jgi:alpha-methylacyl-CoA racemase
VLSGIRIVQLAGIGPAPFAAMTLADHGAAVIRVGGEGTVTVTVPFLGMRGQLR